MAINGRNILVYAKIGTGDFVLIGATRSNEIQTSCGTIAVTNSASPDWETHIIGMKKWSTTVNFLVTDGSAFGLSDSSGIRDLLMAGSQFMLKFCDRRYPADNTAGVQGNATLTSVKITSTIGSLIQGSFTFQGNGELAILETE